MWQSLLISPDETGQIDNFDAYLLLILAPIGILTSLTIIIAHIYSPKLRAHPGDLIMMVAVAELLLTIHWFSSALNSSFFLGGDTSDGTWFCKVESWIAVSGANLEILYNFCFITSIFMKVFLLNAKRIKWYTYHIFSLCIGASIVFYNYVEGYMGLNPYGTCSIKIVSKKSIIAGALSLIVLAIFSIFVLYYTKKVLPQHTEELASLKRNFVNFYSTYLKMLVVLWSVIMVAFMAQNISPIEDGTDNETEVGIIKAAETDTDMTWQDYAFALGKLGNVGKVMTPILFFIIRMRDPLIKHYIYVPFQKSLGILKASTPFFLDAETPSANEDPDSKIKKEELESELVSNTKDLNWINMLNSTIKETLYRTIIASISYYYQPVMYKYRNSQIEISSK